MKTDVEAVAVDVAEAETYGEIVTILRRFEREVRRAIKSSLVDAMVPHASDPHAVQWLCHALGVVAGTEDFGRSRPDVEKGVENEYNPDNGGDDEQG